MIGRRGISHADGTRGTCRQWSRERTRSARHSKPGATRQSIRRDLERAGTYVAHGDNACDWSTWRWDSEGEGSDTENRRERSIRRRTEAQRSRCYSGSGKGHRRTRDRGIRVGHRQDSRERRRIHRTIGRREHHIVGTRSAYIQCRAAGASASLAERRPREGLGRAAAEGKGAASEIDVASIGHCQGLRTTRSTDRLVAKRQRAGGDGCSPDCGYTRSTQADWGVTHRDARSDGDGACRGSSYRRREHHVDVARIVIGQICPAVIRTRGAREGTGDSDCDGLARSASVAENQGLGRARGTHYLVPERQRGRIHAHCHAGASQRDRERSCRIAVIAVHRVGENGQGAALRS